MRLDNDINGDGFHCTISCISWLKVLILEYDCTLSRIDTVSSEPAIGVSITSKTGYRGNWYTFNGNYLDWKLASVKQSSTF